MKTRFFYLIELQYLGFRFHGWQIQPNVKTVQEHVLKTLKWVLPDNPCKVLASGRTDKMVSVNHTYIEVFTEYEIRDLTQFLADFNMNLPSDIRALSMQEVTADFNIIQTHKLKEYHYYFSFGEKFHPFCAAFMTNFLGNLDIKQMQKAARCFEGTHDMFSYVFRPKKDTITTATISSCELIKNSFLKTSFFPEESYVLVVKGTGFKRNQIRLMMGMLFDLGAGVYSWDFFIRTLDGKQRIKLTNIAPASGLQLYNVTLQL